MVLFFLFKSQQGNEAADDFEALFPIPKYHSLVSFFVSPFRRFLSLRHGNKSQLMSSNTFHTLSVFFFRLIRHVFPPCFLVFPSRNIIFLVPSLYAFSSSAFPFNVHFLSQSASSSSPIMWTVQDEEGKATLRGHKFTHKAEQSEARGQRLLVMRVDLTGCKYERLFPGLSFPRVYILKSLAKYN